MNQHLTHPILQYDAQRTVTLLYHIHTVNFVAHGPCHRAVITAVVFLRIRSLATHHLSGPMDARFARFPRHRSNEDHQGSLSR